MVLHGILGKVFQSGQILHFTNLENKNTLFAAHINFKSAGIAKIEKLLMKTILGACHPLCRQYDFNE